MTCCFAGLALFRSCYVMPMRRAAACQHAGLRLISASSDLARAFVVGARFDLIVVSLLGLPLVLRL